MRLHQQNADNEEEHLPGEADSLTACLYLRYAPKLLAYLCQHISSLEDAEDMLFSIFLIVLEHEQTLAVRTEDEQRAWLWKVARNKVIDYHRQAYRHHLLSLEYVADIVDDERGPEQIVLRQEEQDQLHTQLEQLSALQKEVLQLRFTAGLRCAEIAAVLNKREGAIRTLLSRALNTLRSIWTQ
jgi:RNA polymerase sigma factor (sigma-70 family)